MNPRAVAWFERRWYGGVRPNLLLRAVESLFSALVRRRRATYLGSAVDGPRHAVPVVVVGNITVGGAGKTPLTIALIEGLRARGFRPGVISRGYGRRATDVRRVTATDTADTVGDEPMLIALRTGAPVAVAPRRADAAHLLERSGDVDLLIADDGLQHYALKRDIEVLVIDGRRGVGNGRLLPAGPLREPLSRVSACDFVVINAGADEQAPPSIPISPNSSEALLPVLNLLHARAATMHLASSAAVSLRDAARLPLLAFAGQRVHAVAGIADPERFFAGLRRHGIDVVPHPFPDHHAFAATDLVFDEELPVLMTEKDAVKCGALARENCYSVPIDAVLPTRLLDALAARLRALATASAA